MRCRCAELTSLWDAEAKDYQSAHLKVLKVQAGGWEVLFRCPATGLLWLEDWPNSEEHGGGPRRLRRIPDDDLCDDG